MKSFSELIIDKIMCTLTQNFDHIVVAIEESKDVEIIRIEELQGFLEAQELKLIQSGKSSFASTGERWFCKMERKASRTEIF